MSFSFNHDLGSMRECSWNVLYCIVSIHSYSASYSAHQSEALPVRETQREESSGSGMVVASTGKPVCIIEAMSYCTCNIKALCRTHGQDRQGSQFSCVG